MTCVPVLAAGFYYKTFMWPAALWEKLYEPVIRRAAGLGALSGADDPSRYDKGYRHCDLLVIGSGVAGLMAALAAGRAGLDVILAEQDFIMGAGLTPKPTLLMASLQPHGQQMPPLSWPRWKMSG